MDIDYSEIDENLRDLVRLINQEEGIETLFSCEGHKRNGEGFYDGYITFRGDSIGNLERFISKITEEILFFTWSTESFSFQTGFIIDASVHEIHGLTFSLRFDFPSKEDQIRYIRSLEDILRGEYQGPRFIETERCLWKDGRAEVEQD